MSLPSSSWSNDEMPFWRLSPKGLWRASQQELRLLVRGAVSVPASVRVSVWVWWVAWLPRALDSAQRLKKQLKACQSRGTSTWEASFKNRNPQGTPFPKTTYRTTAPGGGGGGTPGGGGGGAGRMPAGGLGSEASGVGTTSVIVLV